MGAKPPWEEVACLGNTCLVDAAIGSKLRSRRAEHVTQVRVCALLVAVSEPPNKRVPLLTTMSSILEWNMHRPLVNIGWWAGSTITAAAIMRAQLSYISTRMTQIEAGGLGFGTS